jgi:single-strand DNA-binding protein
MMMTMNTVTLVGRLGQDPEIRYFETGSVKARFSIAVDRPGSKENRTTDWFNVEAWGKQAEFAGEWIKKGQMVSVSGSLEVSQWADNTGNVREQPIIRVSEIRFVGSKRENEQGAGGYASAGAAVPF